MIIAHCVGENRHISSFKNINLKPRPRQVGKIIIHNVLIEKVSHVHCLENLQNYYSKPIEIWKADVYEDERPAHFLPIQRIKSKCVHANQKFQGVKVIIVIPREIFLF